MTSRPPSHSTISAPTPVIAPVSGTKEAIVRASRRLRPRYSPLAAAKTRAACAYTMGGHAARVFDAANGEYHGRSLRPGRPIADFGPLTGGIHERKRVR